MRSLSSPLTTSVLAIGHASSLPPSAGVARSARVHLGDSRLLEQAERGRARDGVRAGVDAELAVDRAHVRPDRVGREEELLADLPCRQVGGQEPSTASSASARRLEQLSAGCPVSSPSRSSRSTSSQSGRTIPLSVSSSRASRAERSGASASSRRPRRRRARARSTSSQVWCTVATSSREEALGGSELVLCLDELPFGGQHRSQSGGRVRAEPATAAPDPAHGGLRRLGMASGRDELPALGGDEGERRACEDQARRRAARYPDARAPARRQPTPRAGRPRRRERARTWPERP